MTGIIYQNEIRDFIKIIPANPFMVCSSLKEAKSRSYKEHIIYITINIFFKYIFFSKELGSSKKHFVALECKPANS